MHACMCGGTVLLVTTDMWSAYVRRLLALSEQTETAFVRDLSVPQGSFNRWKNGKSVPDKAGDVAQFATECKRNVLEAFVAAGMLTIDDAGKGLPAKSRAFLWSLSEETATVGDSVAAHDEDVSIDGEQEEGDTP